MAVIKESWLARRCAEALASGPPPLPPSSAFFAEDLLWCRRRAALRHRRMDPLPPRDPAWMCRAVFHRTFSVCGEDVHLSDSKTAMGGVADMVVSHSGEKVIVRFWPGLRAKPTILQVADMVLLMYLSGIWSGLLVRHDGPQTQVDFVNPDREDAKRIIEGMHQRSRELMLLVASASTPDGEPGKECHGCPYGEGCANKAKEQES